MAKANTPMDKIKINPKQQDVYLVSNHQGRFLARLSMVLIIALAISSIVIYVFATKRPDVEAFAVNNKGEMSQIYTVMDETDIIPSGVITQFCNNMIENAFSYNYTNANEVLDKNAKIYFSPKVRTKFIDSIKKNIVPLVKENRYITWGEITSISIPEPLQLVNGDKFKEWRVKFKVKITLENYKTIEYAYYQTQVTVKEQPVSKNRYGLVVDSFIFKRGR